MWRVGLAVAVAVGLVAVASLWQPPDGTESARDEPRDFRAARPDTARPEDALLRTVQTLIERVVTDRELSPDAESGLTEELAAALDQHEVGAPERRAEAARAAAASIAEAAAQFAGEHSASDELRRRAVRQQAAALTRTLLQSTGQISGGPAGFGPRPEGHRPLSWNALTDIDYREGDPLPDRVLELDGERVVMAGFLVEVGYGELLLVQSVWGCCFGRPPAIHEAVVVTVEGEPNDAWFDELVRVAGTLEVGEDREAGHLLSVYRLRATQVDALQE